MVFIHRILVALDFSECSDAAAEHAAYLAERVSADVDFLHVLGDGDPSEAHWFVPGRTDLERLDECFHCDAGARLVGMTTSYAARTSTAVRGRLHHGHVATAILQIADLDRYDLIVMGTHGRRGLSHLFVGSVAETVIRQAPCPVLTVCKQRHAGRSELVPRSG